MEETQKRVEKEGQTQEEWLWEVTQVQKMRQQKINHSGANINNLDDSLVRKAGLPVLQRNQLCPA